MGTTATAAATSTTPKGYNFRASAITFCVSNVVFLLDTGWHSGCALFFLCKVTLCQAWLISVI